MFYFYFTHFHSQNSESKAMPDDFINPFADNADASPERVNAAVEAVYKNGDAQSNSTKTDSNTRNEDSGSTAVKPDTNAASTTAEKYLEPNYVRVTFENEPVRSRLNYYNPNVPIYSPYGEINPDDYYNPFHPSTDPLEDMIRDMTN